MSYVIDETKILYADLDVTEGVLLNLETKDYFRLNETGQKIWQGLAARKSIEEIAKDFVETYDVALDEAQNDIQKAVNQLVRHNLLTNTECKTM